MNDSLKSSSRRRRSRGRSATIGVALVVAAGALWYGVHKYRVNAAAQGEFLYGSVQVGDIEDLVTATGTLQPRDYVDVGAQVSGQIEKIYVEVGDEVKAGQVLVEIDATQAALRVDSNRASLRASEISLEESMNSLEKAERDYNRLVNLNKEGATTEEQVLNAATQLRTARNRIITQEATIAQQKANMQVEESNLKFTKIVAPFDGTVMSIAVRQGATVNATNSSPNILRIADLSTMTVQAEVSEADYPKLSPDMDVYFTTLSSQRRWYGKLKRIEPTPKVQNSVVLYNALFDVVNDSGDLRPSMTAQVFFVRAEARNVLTVPMAALQQGPQLAREMGAANRERGAGAPAAAGADAAAGARPDGAAPEAGADAGAGAQAAAGGTEGQGARGGQRGAGGPGGFPGGSFPGANGQITPEQMEQFRRMREQRGGGGGAGGARGGAMTMGGGPRFGSQGQSQRRNGTVMVKTADGKMEPREVVIGVTNRVHGEVISGLTEGEEVVIGRRETETATTTPNPQQNQGRPNNMGGGFPGGGGFRF